MTAFLAMTSPGGLDGIDDAVNVRDCKHRASNQPDGLIPHLNVAFDIVFRGDVEHIIKHQPSGLKTDPVIALIAFVFALIPRLHLSIYCIDISVVRPYFPESPQRFVILEVSV